MLQFWKNKAGFFFFKLPIASGLPPKTLFTRIVMVGL